MSRIQLIIGILFYACAILAPIAAARSAAGEAVWRFMLGNAELIAKAIIIAIIIGGYSFYLLIVLHAINKVIVRKKELNGAIKTQSKKPDSIHLHAACKGTPSNPQIPRRNDESKLKPFK